MYYDKAKDVPNIKEADNDFKKRKSKRSKCYDCNNELNRESHKVTLRDKVRFFCAECYFEMVERMRREKNG